MNLKFTIASKEQAKLRLALYGPPGSGKTYTSLALAQALGKKVAVIDTEHGRASKYADLFNFDVVELDSFQPQLYVEAIHAAEAAGYDVLVIDSLSHAWSGKGGLLEQVDEFAKRSPSQNTFIAWKQGTPIQNAMVEAINGCGMHIICTLRTKIHYTMETNDRGKTEPKRIGLEPIQREGMEYEFDITGQMNSAHEWVIEKTTCPALVDKVIPKPGAETAKIILDWLTSGTKAKPHAKASMTADATPEGTGIFCQGDSCGVELPARIMVKGSGGTVKTVSANDWAELATQHGKPILCPACLDASKKAKVEEAA
jgi:DNA polymerase III delta prime subunit